MINSLFPLRNSTRWSNLPFSLFFFICLPLLAYGQVTLPRLISDGMVLQRDTEVTIWGWASKGERISVRFLGSVYTTTANANGDWHVTLPGMSPGGPYEMTIEASNVIAVKDIMVGDIWVCSGQSNMELSMRRVSPVYQKEISTSTNSQIRQFLVPQRYEFNKPRRDVDSGTWRSANPESVLDFSAVAYFFARQLYDAYKVPIGLINASLGGSPAEAWMSEEALKHFTHYHEEALKFRDSTLVKEIESRDRERIQAWYSLLRDLDEGYRDDRKPWFDPDLETSGWSTVKVPGFWPDTPIGPVNGVVWFRKKVSIPSSILGKKATLILGRIVDADSVFVNGVFVGATGYQWPPRRYPLPQNVLHEGENTIVVRVINSSGRGGFVPDKPYELWTADTTINLKGDWQCRLGATMEPLAAQTFIRWKPLGLFNAMIAPLLNYRIKGVIWYQGESNTGRAIEYRKLFPALIRDWRSAWNQGDFPFLFVQLSAFMEPKSQPSESDWALLREAQAMALSIPRTAMAVTIDIGEWNDIHPLNKEDVGKRLALAARRVAYGDDVVHSGPVFQSMRIEGSRAVLSFVHEGSGLMAKGDGRLRSFTIAGPDKKFVWAQARIEGKNVVVWSDQVSNPVAVRYAWADNPEGANLCNREGLPAVPFRTDDWTVPR